MLTVVIHATTNLLAFERTAPPNGWAEARRVKNGLRGIVKIAVTAACHR